MSAPGQIHHPHPVPYYDDSPAHPAPACRVLFAAGAWLVPESERPADWQDRTLPRDYKEEGAAAFIHRVEHSNRHDGVGEHHPPTQATRAPHAKGVGRPKLPPREPKVDEPRRCEGLQDAPCKTLVNGRLKRCHLCARAQKLLLKAANHKKHYVPIGQPKEYVDPETAIERRREKWRASKKRQAIKAAEARA